MAVSVAQLRAVIDESINLLNNRGEETEPQDPLSKLEAVRSVLIRNEKKIWLRTKKGRKMLADVSEAVERLKGALASLDDWGTVDTALGEVETLARAIEEESRKRSMVVT